MLKLTVMVSYEGSYLDNTYLKLKVHWSDSDTWLPDKKNITKQEDGSYNMTTMCMADLVLLLCDIADSTEIDTINILFDSDYQLDSFRSKFKILTKQEEGNRLKTVKSMTNSIKEQERSLQFFSNSKLNVTIY